MEQMKKPLSPKVLGAVLALLLALIGVAYFFLIIQPVRITVENAKMEKESIQIELDAIELQKAELARIQRELEQLRQDNVPFPTFDNQKLVTASLNSIMQPCIEFDIEQNEPQIEEGAAMARRSLTLEFKCDNYYVAQRLINQLHALPFRLQVSVADLRVEKEEDGQTPILDVFDVINSEDDKDKVGNMLIEKVAGTVVVTYFESL